MLPLVVINISRQLRPPVFRGACLGASRELRGTCTGCPTVRLLSSDALRESAIAIIHTSETLLQTIHHHTHLPWWAVIVMTTISLRSLVTLPLAVRQNVLMAKMELLLPTLREYQEAVKHNVVVRSRRAGLSVEEANRRIRIEARKVARDLYTQEGCNPYKMAVLPWVQLPLWITISLALRNMSGYFPGLAPSQGVQETLASEGMLWFPDLTLPDPYSVLPILLATTNLLNIEIHALRQRNPGRGQRIMTNIFRLLSLGMGYIGGYLPAAMTLYWATSSSYGLTQNILFKLPRVRRALGIPRTPSEKKRPFHDLATVGREKLQTFLELQRKAQKHK